MNAQTAYDRIAAGRIMAGMRGDFPPDVALAVARTLIESAQIDLFEFTMNSTLPLEAMQATKHAFPDAVVGMGTVLDVETAQRVIDAGADFVIAPSYNRDVVELTHAAGLLCVPGVITPTEAVDAWATGAKLLKIFPIGTLGLEYFKAIRAPLDHIHFICNGGMTDANVGEFLRAGAVACGMAGWLTGSGAMPLDEIARRARILREIVVSIDTGMPQRVTI
jgi:2-dehydro-3-deoxyphosphogluconate aldolase/(4S)-4-hydroxy-2-oxoglutarate aldolase